MPHAPLRPQVTRGWPAILPPEHPWQDPALDVFSEADIVAAELLAQQARVTCVTCVTCVRSLPHASPAGQQPCVLQGTAHLGL
jgi:hypothetical protein